MATAQQPDTLPAEFFDSQPQAHAPDNLPAEFFDDPIHAKPSRPEDLPSREHLEASHQAAVTGLQQKLNAPTGPTMSAAPAPSLFERLKRTILGNPQGAPGETDTPIGRALGQSFEAPTEPHTPTTSLPAARVTAVAPNNPQSVAGGIGKGAAEFAEGMTTAPNLLMAAGSGGLGILGKVSSYLPRAVSAAFSLDMLHSAYQQAPAVKAAIDKGDWPGAAAAITKAGLTAGMGLAAGAHAVRGDVRSAPSNEGAKPEASPVERAAESARAGAEALTPDTLPADHFDKSAPDALPAEFFDKEVKNPNRRVTGSSNVPLSEEGRAQSQKLADQTAGQFTRVNVSPMDRAQETAQMIAGKNPEAQAQTSEQLGPWKLGEHEGKPVETEKAAIDERIRNAPHEAPPGRGEQSTAEGEPFNAFRDRSIQHLQDQVMEMQPGDKVLNVTHGRNLRLIDSWLKNGAPDDRSIDADEMTKDGDWSEPSQLFKLEEGGLKPAKNAEEPGIYYARHGATDFNADASAKPADDISTESKTSPPEPKPAETKASESGQKAEAQPETGPLPRAETLKPDVAKGLTEGAKRVNPDGSVQVLRRVPVDDIYPAEGNQIYPDVVRSYRQSGYSVQPELKAREEGGFTIGEGHHRITSDIQNGKSDVLAWTPASLLTDDEISRTARSLGLDESEIRKAASLNPDELMQQARHWNNAYDEAFNSGKTIREISDQGLDSRAGLYGDLSLRAARRAPRRAVPEDRTGKVMMLPGSELHVDPVRFQYKAATGAGGAGEELRGVQKWDPEKGGILSVWHDPEDGKTYVVNGHNRYALGERAGAPDYTVRYLDAANAAEARTKGALINIAEGRGDALDAAKVFRDGGLDAEELKQRGISLKGEKASQGLALAKLDPALFSEVVSGRLPVERAVVIGRGVESPEDQKALVDLLDQRERGGKRLTNDQVAEMIRLTNDAPKQTDTQETLFGSQEMTRSLIPEKAEVSDFVRKRLAGEKKLFATVGTESAAAQLGASGNVIKAGENAQVAERAGQAQALYDKLSASAGPISNALDAAAQAIAKGENANAAKERAYGNIKTVLLDQAARLAGEGEGRSSGSPSERPEGDVAQGTLGLGPGKRGERGSIDPNLLTLGAAKFVEKDIAPTVQRVASDLVEAKDQALRMLAPQLRGEGAEYTGLSLRQRMAQFARRYDQGAERLKAARDFFNGRTAEENYKFIGDIEKGRATGDENMDAIAGTFRRMLDQRRREVQALGEGELEKFYQNYFPHIFERPEQAGKFLESFFGDRRRIEGPKSFLKHREFPTFQEALDAGQKPVSDNPVELVMMKVREMDRYLLAHAVLRDMADRGIAKRVTGQQAERSSGQEVLRRPEDVTTKGELPPNFISIRDPIGGGKWYAEQGAADVLNNYLTPGLRAKSGAYRILSGINNTMNQANLGLSAFHLTGEVIRSGVSRAALGIEDMFHGKPLRGSLRVATFPAGPVLDYMRGSKVLHDWFKPGSEGAPIAAITDALTAGGGRARMDAAFQTGAWDSMTKALRDGNLPGALIRAPWALLEKASHPMMEALIPRLKLGVFHGMAADALERLGPGADVEQVRKAMAPIWDSVDNRMGQVVYDNLFWNRTFKDLSHLMVRSVGWNLGTIREIGGGTADLANLLRGRKPDAMHRIAYTLALPLISGMIGAFYQYMHTGQGPQELKDYFFPKRENGQRIALPTDVKDVYHYATDPVRTIENKTGPLLNTTIEMLHNRDFYDRPIRNVDDPFMKQLQQEADFVGRQFLPFTLQPQMGKKQPEEPNPEHKVENYLGFTKAPGDIQGGKKPKAQPSKYGQSTK